MHLYSYANFTLPAIVFTRLHLRNNRQLLIAFTFQIRSRICSLLYPLLHLHFCFHTPPVPPHKLLVSTSSGLQLRYSIK